MDVAACRGRAAFGRWWLSRPSGQRPGPVLAGKAEDEQPAQVERGNPDRQPHVVALDAVVGHPAAAVGDQPGDRAFHHRPPAPVAVLEGAGGGAAAGGAQLVLVRVDADGAPAARGRAALPQRAAPAVAGEAGLPGRGDRRLVAGRAADRAGLLVDGEVVLTSWCAIAAADRGIAWRAWDGPHG